MHRRANFPQELDMQSVRQQRPLAAEVKEDESFGIAGMVWQGAHLLNAYLSPSSDLHFDPPCPLLDLNCSARAPVLLELGAGTGYTGLMLSRALPPSSRFILTDLPEVCEGILGANAAQDKRLEVMPLQWGNDEHAAGVLQSVDTIDYVLVADCVYFRFLFQPLIDTLLSLTDAHLATIIISYKIRNLTREQDFWAQLGRHFDLTAVQARNAPDAPFKRFGLEEGAFVFVVKRKARSSEELDDQFERLLLCDIDID